MASDPLPVRRARTAVRVVGWTSLVLSVFGLLYHASYLRCDYSHQKNPPYFFQAWYTMAAINIALLIAGIFLGIALIRVMSYWVPYFVVLQALIVLDLVIPGMLWLHPRLGRSIGAASGIAGGTVLHAITLFPLWGTAAALWAAHNISDERKPGNGPAWLRSRAMAVSFRVILFIFGIVCAAPSVYAYMVTPPRFGSARVALVVIVGFGIICILTSLLHAARMWFFRVLSALIGITLILFALAISAPRAHQDVAWPVGVAFLVLGAWCLFAAATSLPKKGGPTGASPPPPSDGSGP